jgi:hypothetical protein
VTERAVWFGAGKTLSGVLTEPARSAPGRPAVVLLNAGLLHRVGPNRLYVSLARRLAAAGLPVLRMDYSGLGDSEPRRDELALEQSMLAEGVEALDFLQSSGVADRFVPMGLCAGAEQSQRLADADGRVVGGVLIDGYAYRTIGYYLREYARHVLSARSWRALARSPRAARRLLGGGKAAAAAGGAGDGARPRVNPGGVTFVREFPPREACLTQLERILARKVELYVVFTGGGMAELYNYAGQFETTFPSLRHHPRIRLDFMPLADHTFTLRAHQDALLASIDGWAREKLVAGVDAPLDEASAPPAAAASSAR